MKRKSVLVWNENARPTEAEATAYPEGIHRALAACLAADPELEVRTASLDDPDAGLADTVLAQTDCLIVWAHVRHTEMTEDCVLRVQRRVLEGMGLVVLHSAVWWKPFVRLMGTTCQLNYRMVVERESLWCVNPTHPIAAGVGAGFSLKREEVYCEYFDIPAPDEIVFLSAFEGGEAFRSGCCWVRGAGRIFYFRPGHETLPTYHDPRVQRVLKNAVHWSARSAGMAFESGPKQAGFLDRPEPSGQPKIIGSSHLFAGILPPQDYIR